MASIAVNSPPTKIAVTKTNEHSRTVAWYCQTIAAPSVVPRSSPTLVPFFSLVFIFKKRNKLTLTLFEKTWQIQRPVKIIVRGTEKRNVASQSVTKRSISKGTPLFEKTVPIDRILATGNRRRPNKWIPNDEWSCVYRWQWGRAVWIDRRIKIVLFPLLSLTSFGREWKCTEKRARARALGSVVSEARRTRAIVGGFVRREWGCWSSTDRWCFHVTANTLCDECIRNWCTNTRGHSCYVCVGGYITWVWVCVVRTYGRTRIF